MHTDEIVLLDGLTEADRYDQMGALRLIVQCAEDVLGAVGYHRGALVLFEATRVVTLGPDDTESWADFGRRASHIVAHRAPLGVGVVHPCKATEPSFDVSVEMFTPSGGVYRLRVVGPDDDTFDDGAWAVN